MNNEIYQIRDRMWLKPEEVLEDLLKRFDNGTIPETNSHMEHHFKVAKHKPETFRNHGKVLAVSFGGSNTKVMLASTEDGFLRVNHVYASPNPEQKVQFYDYMDQLLLGDPAVRDYLDSTPCPEIGVSIPMMIFDDVPFHPTKLATIDGFIARTQEEINPQNRFSDLFDAYMKQRGWPNYRVIYKSDGIVAHHGAVSFTDIKPEDRTVLTIIGTGMANGDELYYQPMGMINTLPEDEELFPAKFTEDRQLQYAIAGKGLWVIMKSAIMAWNRTGKSLLEGKGLEDFFRDARDSKWVIMLYTHKMDPTQIGKGLDQLLEAAGDGLEELEMLAEFVVVQMVNVVARMIYATYLRAGTPEEGGRYVLYLEGSIARSPMVRKALLEEVDKLLLKDSPYTMVEDPPLKPYRKGEGCTDEMLGAVDTTLAGTASMIIADCSEM